MTTEWDDIQRKFGNLPPLEVAIPEEAIEAIAEESAQRSARDRYQSMRSQELDAIDADELDDEDERVLSQIRRQRLAELQRSARGERFGAVAELYSQSHFVDEVTHAGKDIWVVCMLYESKLVDCEILASALPILARKFPQVKFTKGLSSACMASSGGRAGTPIPHASLPLLLVYRNGAVMHKFAGLHAFGGKRLLPNDVEWELAQIGVVDTQLEDNPHLSVDNRIFLNIHRR